MHADHLRLEALYDELLNAFDAGAREATQALWSKLEQGLERHMQLEEALFFPQFDEVDPEEVAALREAHAQIRRGLADLGAAVDLKAVSPALAHEFIGTLRAHAAREDEELYRWANQALQADADLVLRGLGHTGA